jgi:FtsH-binding integral membrane protein
MQNYETIRTNTATMEYDPGLRQYMLSVFNNMSLALGVSAVISYFIGTSPTLMFVFFGGPQKWLFMLAPLAFVLAISFFIVDQSLRTTKIMLFVFAGLMGVSLATVFAVFKMGSIAQAFFATAAMFGTMSLWGYTTKRDLTKMGSFLIMGAFGLLIASLLNLVFASGALAMVVSGLAVVIFAGLTAYDVQSLKGLYYELEADDEREKAGVMGALSLYLNFINIFTSWLNLFGERNSE